MCVCVCVRERERERVYASYSVKSTNVHIMIRIMIQDGHCTYNVTLRHVSVTIVGVEKQAVHILCVCSCVCVFVAIVIQHATRVRHIAICGLLPSTVFFHIS